MSNKLTLLIFLSLTWQAHGDIYKWTDNQGVVHFSDYPHEGSQPVKGLDIQSYSSPTPPSNNAEPVAQEEKAEKPQKDYKVSITEPTAEATIRNNQGDVAVTVEVVPNLAKEDSIQLVYDGAVTGDPQKSPTFQISGVYRGKHTIAVQIIDSEGQVLATSEAINIYMQRPRVGMVHPAG